MRAPLFALIFPAMLAAGNLLPDAGFELGGADYAKPRYTLLETPEHGKYLPPVSDADAVHGKYSLRFDNPRKEPAVLRTPDFRVTPGKPYTFSFYAKSDKPVNLRVNWMSVVTAEKKLNGRWFNPSRTFTLTQEWRRHQFTVTPTEGFESLLIDLLWGDGSDATVRFDAFQVEEGSAPTAFAVKEKVEMAVTAPSRLRIDGEKPLVYTLNAVNYGEAAKNLKVTFREYDDYRNRELGSSTVEVEIPPGETIRRDFTVPGRPYGVYSIRGEYETDGRTVEIMPYLYANSGRYTAKPFDPDQDFVAGVEDGLGFGFSNINGGKTHFTLAESDVAEYDRVDANQGYRLLRIGNGAYCPFNWRAVEPEPGKFGFALADRMVDRRLAGGNTVILGVLGHVMLERHLPEWQLKRGFLTKFRILGKPGFQPALEDWRRYVRTVVTHFKGRVRYWEVLNEANLTTSPEDYLELLKIAFEECRKIDPAIKVVAPNVTGDHGGEMGRFLEEFGKLGGFQYTDIVSFHPYSSREERSPNPAPVAIHDIRAIVARYRAGLPLWNTELYYLREQSRDNDAREQGRVAAGDFVRRILLDLGENVRQATLLPEEKSYRRDRNFAYGYFPGRMRRNVNPSDVYVAVNAFARLMEGAVPVEKATTPRGATFYLYRLRDNTPMAALWNYTEKQKFTVTFAEPGTLELFDLFGNPLPAATAMPLSGDPIYVRGKGDMAAFVQTLKAAQITPENGYEATRARWFAQDGRPAVAVEFRSTTETQNLKVRLLSAPGVTVPAAGSQPLPLAAGKSGVILFPIEVAGNTLPAGTVRLLVYDGRNTRTLELPIEAQRFLRDHETARPEQITHGKKPAGFNCSFQAQGTPAAFTLSFDVRDPQRGRHSSPDFWNGDCIELFFDRTPLADLERREYRPDTFRLFLSPAADDKPARLNHQGDVDPAKLRWQITDTPTGYTAHLEIPWSELRLPPNSPVSFDAAVNDNDGQTRTCQLTWSGTPENFRHRHTFGFWLP